MERYKRVSLVQGCALMVVAVLLLHRGNTESFSCTPSLSEPVCNGSIVTCTCEATPIKSNSATRWSFTNVTGVCNNSNSFITLSLPTPCNILNGICGPYLSAAVVFVGGICTNTSVLNITADPHLNGLEITCIDMSFHPVMHIIGNATLRVTDSPGPVGNMTVTSTSVHQLTVTWTPPTTGGVPTSYNVTINDSSNTQASIPANGPLQYTFTNLTNGTLYTVSMAAINCAGSSYGTNGTGQCMGTPGSSSPGIHTPSSPAGQGEDGGAIGGAVGGALLGLAGVGVGVGIAAYCIWKNRWCKECHSSVEDDCGTSNSEKSTNLRRRRGKLDSECSRKHLMQIAKYDFDCEAIGQHLLGWALDIGRKKDLTEQQRRGKVLEVWHDQLGSGATYRKLIETFEVKGYNSIAEKVQILATS